MPEEEKPHKIQAGRVILIREIEGPVLIQVIIFDVDGVLVNGERFNKRLIRDYGITEEMTASFFKGRFSECLIGKADLKQELGDYLPQWGWQGSVDEFMSIWFRHEHCIDEQLVRQIQQWRQQGIRCYIATNQEKYRTAYMLEQMGFAKAFDGCFSSAHVGCLKDDRAFFAHVLDALHNVQADDILFWDDSIGNVTTAQSVGLHAEFYYGFADFEKKMSQYLDS